MKTIILAAAFAVAATAAYAQYTSPYGTTSPGLYGTGSNPNSHYVSPHTTRSGTYVPGHYQTNPNNTQLDNYSTRGNVNPYTGSYGTRGPRY